MKTFKRAIKVLDHGLVRGIDYMGDDLAIVRAARISYDAAPRAGKLSGSDYRLIHYLMKHQHTSPFEMVEFKFEIKAPIFTFRQWHRHRTQSYNEQSARYSILSEEFYVPELDQITYQSTDNKQMRTKEKNPEAFLIQNIIKETNANAFRKYHKMLELNCPRELARSVLPVGTYSHMFAKMNLLNLFRFLRLRLDENHAQHEIVVYAKAMLQLIEPIAPIAVEAFKESLK